MVSPVTVVLVAGGEPLMVLGVCGVEPMKGVILYDVGDPPVAGADHVTLADVLPAVVAVTFVTWPGGGVDVNRTSTQ